MRLDAVPRETAGNLVEVLGDECGMVKGPGARRARRDGYSSRLRRCGIARALRDVHAGRPARVEPVAGEWQGRTRPDCETERVAVEVARRLDVVGEHQEVLKMRDWHEWCCKASCRPYPQRGISAKQLLDVSSPESDLLVVHLGHRDVVVDVEVPDGPALLVKPD